MPIVSNQTLNAAALSYADQLNLTAVAYKGIRPDVNDSPRGVRTTLQKLARPTVMTHLSRPVPA